MKLAVSAFLLLLVGGGALAAPAQDLPRGAIVDKVVCRAESAQSYALYLPSQYSAQKAWPILYALDPGARGRLPVERFKDAAERLGFIVAGSNNSRNGPIEVADAAVNAMIADTRARFSLDSRRVYAVGFSGAARVAIMLATAMNGGMAGVMAFGAGFPERLAPTASIRFAIFGAAGTEDFNYPELAQLDRTLTQLKLRHQFLVFEGPHDWPPAALCGRALDWMEIEAMRGGIRPADPSLVEAAFSRAMGEAASEEQAGRGHLAQLWYEGIAKDFAGLRDVTASERRARELSARPDVKTAAAVMRDSIDLQLVLWNGVQALVLSAFAGEDQLAGTHQLLAETARIRKRAESAKRPAEKMAARRVLGSTWVWLSQGVDDDLARGDYARAATRLRVMTELRPDNWRAEWRLARANARAGNRKAALEALRRAVAKGFTDVEAVEKEPDLEPIRREAVFRTLVESLRK